MLRELSLTVAVLTYRRPADLAAVLPALAAQAADVRDQVSSAGILVVDNSPDADARAFVESFAATSSVEVMYESEPRPGIPAARNRALQASSESDLLVFIDDDERPVDQWLSLLISAFARFDAVAVVGSVVSTYEVAPSEWIEAGDFFRRRRPPTGTTLTVAATNNLLIDLRTVRSVPLSFDLDMGLNGGDDTLFTSQLARHGRMVWCDEAVVRDVVPQHRLTTDWVLRRALRSGNSSTLVATRLAHSPWERLHARLAGTAAGLVRVGGGGAKAAIGAMAGRLDLQANGARTAARGTGMLLGVAGVSYQEYRRPDASNRRLVLMRRRPGPPFGAGDSAPVRTGPARPVQTTETSGLSIENQATGPTNPPDAAPVNGDATRAAVRWTAIAVAVKQALQILFGLVLARVLGPQLYGVVAAATIYVTLSALVLDQGMSAALIQRRILPAGAAGALATVNLGTGAVLAVVTWFAAPGLADFFASPDLTPVLRLLGAGLILKAIAVAPRAMLSRGLRFTRLAVADVAGAAAGAAVGLIALMAGAGYSSLIFQVGTMDLMIAVLALRAVRGPWPNLRLATLRELVPFGAKIFATNALAYTSSNADNILVGRYLGTASLAYYSIAYRVLVIPILLLGQTVNRVLFPLFARLAGNRAEVSRTLVAATETLATVAVPLMSLISCAAPQLVALGLGPQWSPAAVLISILAIAGARETIFFITPALMRGLDHAGLNFRFQILSTAVQLTGIAIGLQHGAVGVAVGYAIAGFALTPVLLAIQRRLTGVPLRSQWAAIWPAVHISAWAAAGYLIIGRLLSPPLLVLTLGTTLYIAILGAVLWLFHRDLARRTVSRLLKRRHTGTMRSGG